MNKDYLEDRWFSRGEAMSQKAERAHLARQIATGEFDAEELEALSFHSLPIWLATCICGWNSAIEAVDKFDAEASASVIHDLQVHPHCKIFDGIDVRPQKREFYVE